MISVTRIGADDAPRRFVFIHGILGRGSNWRSVARAFVQARPEYEALLVDLRLHGESGNEFPLPDTVEACARDIHMLGHKHIDAVLGHSFGSKVALAYAPKGATVFTIDASPGPRPERRGSETVLSVLEALRTLEGQHFTHRRDFVAALGAKNVSRPIGLWLAMNLKEQGGRLAFGVDLDRIDALLNDYFQADCWPAFEAHQAHLIVGGRSAAVSSEERSRAEYLGRLSVFEEAGHWVHVDAREPLTELLIAEV